MQNYEIYFTFANFSAIFLTFYFIFLQNSDILTLKPSY